MTRSGMVSSTAGSTIEDIAYLVRSEHRVSTLVALTARPRSKAELGDATGVSSSTIRRTLRAFEDRDWIHREGYKYEATELGAFIASAIEDVVDRFETERKLRDVWHLLPNGENGFTIETYAEADVTVAEPGAPYLPVNRFQSLLQETSEFRFVGYGIAVLEPCWEAFCQRIVDGMVTEIIAPTTADRAVHSMSPKRRSNLLERGNLTILLHDELPLYGIGRFDDRIAVCCHDHDSGTVRALVESEDPAAHEWAASIYASYHGEARPLEPALAVE